MHSTLTFPSFARFAPFVALALVGVQTRVIAQTSPVDAVNMTQGSVTQRASAMLRDGRRAAAEDLLSKYLATNQGDGRAWLLLGTIHFDDARRWHREGHKGEPSGPSLLEFAASSFEAAQQLLTDSGNVYRVLVAVERATLRVEDSGWTSVAHWDVNAEELPLPPVLAELGKNLLASCPSNGILVTGSMVETAAAWGTRLLAGARSDLVLLRPDLYQWDARYRAKMSETLHADSSADLPTALVKASATRPICLGPTVDSITRPALEWRPVRLVLSSSTTQPPSDPLSVFQFGRTGLAGSLWTAAAREVYDLAARRNQVLCSTLFANAESQGLPRDFLLPSMSSKEIRKVLVANRGEIALRIMRACRDEGLETVAVFSDADRHAPFVRAANQAVRIGPAPPGESYLRIEGLLDAARATGADAIHPGYGFLSERAAFAQAVAEAGLVFIGPPAAAISAMGDKTSARRLMEAAGVPIVPGTTAAMTDPAEAAKVAAQIGFPILVKAAAGGGGKGMRVVHEASGLAAALTTAASEALKAFGDGSVYLEKYIERPRHVEIQVLADHERTIHVGERECSIQRRHQKLVEEAPSVAVDAPLREKMGAAAVAAATAVGYRGAGTCEFLLGADGAFYFLEMNTRIQVEHPVTEEVYGVDLVREQLRIARGLPMSIPAGPLAPRGWAMECRITSEDPANALLPSSGTIRWMRAPSGPGVRWESGIEAGSEVTLYYDSMLAKLIVHAPSRLQAIEAMRRALDELIIVGVATNVPFHRHLLSDPDFVRGAIDIQYLERNPRLLALLDDDTTAIRLAVVAALLEQERRQSRRPLTNGPGHAAATSTPWRDAARRDALR